MIYKIKDISGEEVNLKLRVEHYSVQDFMGEEHPGLAIELDEVDENGEYICDYATLTVNFGEFIAPKNCAYIDTNNCYFADQLLEQGMATQTQFTKRSGFCTYPLWIFNEDVLKEMGGENYQKYSEDHDDYFAAFRGEKQTDEEPNEDKNEIKM